MHYLFIGGAVLVSYKKNISHVFITQITTSSNTHINNSETIFFLACTEYLASLSLTSSFRDFKSCYLWITNIQIFTSTSYIQYLYCPFNLFLNQACKTFFYWGLADDSVVKSTCWLSEDLNLFPSTHVIWLTTTYNSGFLFWPPQAPAHMWYAHLHPTCAHT